MRFAILATALSLLSLTSASPIAKRQSTDIDATILQYALTLEHLEDTFYRTYLAKFDAADFTNAGYDSSVRARIAEISSHEKSHVAFLTAGLTAAGATPTAECEYSFPVKDVKSFLAVASILEGVGVSAYLGAAALITNPDYLTAAGSILTVESRHSAYVRSAGNGESPFPAAYDIPLDFNQVYSLAAPFITSCPSTNPTLPVKAFPGLTATPVGSSKPSGMVKLVPSNATSIEGKGQLYAAFIGFPANSYGLYDSESMTVTIPASASGQTYVVLTTSNSSVTDDNTVAGVGVFEVTASE